MKEHFGKSPEGVDVYLYAFENKKGMQVKIMNYGATLCSILFPDKDGKLEHIALGFKDLQDYISGNNPYMGCIVGRFANRISQAKFTLEGVEYRLAANDGSNHSHGGLKGFNRVVWDTTELEGENYSGLELTYLSKDGEEGYPGNLNVKVTYKLTDENELKIGYQAETDKKTILNLTSHIYFNLCGNAKKDILDHEVKIHADTYTEADSSFIPTGEIKLVDDTPFDFKEYKKIGKDIVKAGGYNHNFAVNPVISSLRKVVEVKEPESGRKMDVYTTEPGIQFYTSDYLDGTLIGLEGIPYKKQFGFCLEAQHFPDSPNQPDFPSVVLNPGDTYTQETVYKFSFFS